MLNILSSRTTESNRQFREVPRQPGENNVGWIRRVAGVMGGGDESRWTDLVLLGGVSSCAFRLRVAQSHIRHDLTPSHWSHVLLLAGPADGEAKETSNARRARSERLESRRFPRHDLKAPRGQLHDADLASRPHRTDRLSIQADLHAPRVADQQPHFFGRFHNLRFVRLQSVREDVLPVRGNGDPGFFVSTQADS